MSVGIRANPKNALEVRRALQQCKTVATNAPTSASGISNAPAGGISSTTVQGAINELDSEKADKVAGAMVGHLASLNSSGNIQDSGYSNSSFDVAGSAAAVQGNLSTHVAATGTAVHGLGTAATRNVAASGNASSSEVVKGDDTRLTDSRTPSAHATTHKSGGGDPIKLDELAAPTDVTTLNVSTAAHGLCPKAPNNTTQFLRGDGAWASPTVAPVRWRLWFRS